MQMKVLHKVLCLLMILSVSLVGFAQKDTLKLQREARALLRDGNKLYTQGKFGDASIAYRKALDKNSGYEKATYNYGNALYQDKKYKEAVEQFELTAKNSNDKFAQAEAYHNIGNAMMEQKQYGPAIEAYKNALRRNPKDDETRYNLAVAQKYKQEQDQNGGGDDNQDNKDKNDQNKDQQNKDQNKDGEGDNKDKKDKQDGDKDNENKKDQNQDQKDKEGDQDKKDQQNKNGDQKDEQKQQPKPQPGKMSQEQIQQLLESLNNEEKKTQKKMNVQKSKGRKVNQEKDW